MRGSCLVLGLLFGGTATLVDASSNFPYAALRVLMGTVLAKRGVLALAGATVGPYAVAGKSAKHDVLCAIDSWFSYGCWMGALATLLAACRYSAILLGAPHAVLAVVEVYTLYWNPLTAQQTEQDIESSFPSVCGALGLAWGILLPWWGPMMIRVAPLLCFSPVVVVWVLDSLLTSAANRFSEEQPCNYVVSLWEKPGLCFGVGSLVGGLAKCFAAAKRDENAVVTVSVPYYCVLAAVWALLTVVAFQKYRASKQQSSPAESEDEEESEVLTANYVRVL